MISFSLHTSADFCSTITRSPNRHRKAKTSNLCFGLERVDGGVSNTVDILSKSSLFC